MIIRPATGADQATITRLIQQAHLNPCYLYWAQIWTAAQQGS